jgi:hypothetical protein
MLDFCVSNGCCNPISRLSLERRNEKHRRLSDILIQERQPGLVAHVRRFAAQMPPAATGKELIAARSVERMHDTRSREGPTRYVLMSPQSRGEL